MLEVWQEQNWDLRGVTMIVKVPEGRKARNKLKPRASGNEWSAPGKMKQAECLSVSSTSGSDTFSR